MDDRERRVGDFLCPFLCTKFEILSQEHNSAMDTYFPLKSVKKHISDKLWVTNNIKLLISKRQSAFIRHGKDSLVYKFWKNKAQRDIKLEKSLYYNNKINDLAQSNARKWWQQIKSLTGQDAPSKQARYHQFPKR